MWRPREGCVLAVVAERRLRGGQGLPREGYNDPIRREGMQTTRDQPVLEAVENTRNRTCGDQQFLSLTQIWGKSNIYCFYLSNFFNRQDE